MDYKERIIELLKSTQREGVEQLIDWLEKSQFYDAPASVRFHNNFLHGLEKHSFEVYEEAMRLRDEAIDVSPNLESELPLDSVILCSLLHDICKTDVYYISNSTGEVKSRRPNYMKGHGQRSVRILEDIGLYLTELEKWAIWWHMGPYEVSRELYPEEYMKAETIPLCQLIHTADSNAARNAIIEQYQ